MFDIYYDLNQDCVIGSDGTVVANDAPVTQAKTGNTEAFTIPNSETAPASSVVDDDTDLPF